MLKQIGVFYVAKGNGKARAGANKCSAMHYWSDTVCLLGYLQHFADLVWVILWARLMP